MDRKKQLSNVAFGGAWSEQIAENETITLAMARLDRAVEDTLYEDLRGFEEVTVALRIACDCHPKGEMLAAAWGRALAIQESGIRSTELARLAKAIRLGLGDRVAANRET